MQNDEMLLSEEDLKLKAEWDVIERFFSVKTIDDTPLAQREKSVRRLAMSLFGNYFDAEERDDILFGPNWVNKDFVISDWTNKADKLYEIAGDYSTAKKILNFLQIVDSESAKNIIKNL